MKQEERKAEYTRLQEVNHSRFWKCTRRTGVCDIINHAALTDEPVVSDGSMHLCRVRHKGVAASERRQRKDATVA